MKIAIIKYNAGNTRSLTYALERLGIQPLITDEAEALNSADKVIFPGVGEASTAMRYLRAQKIDQIIRDLRQPFLGICLGMQLMCQYSEENDTHCLGLLPERVLRFPNPTETNIKIPQMGWNTLHEPKGALFKGIPAGAHVYFVHSYYVEHSEHTIAGGEYILPFSAGIQKDNFYAVQFHPEKSGKTGAQLLENFLNI